VRRDTATQFTERGRSQSGRPELFPLLDRAKREAKRPLARAERVRRRGVGSGRRPPPRIA
jgi:hypothetical protein